MGQTLPVIVETSEFTSELTVTNFSEEPRTLDFQFVADGIEADGQDGGLQHDPGSRPAARSLPRWWKSCAARGWRGWGRPGASTPERCLPRRKRET